MLCRGVIAGLIAAALLVVPASAATRYASPTGSGPPGAGGCPLADPCAIEAAIEDPAVGSGDEVLLAPGTYDIAAATVIADDAITVRARDAGTRPLLTGTAPTVLRVDGAGTIRDLAISNTTSSSLATPSAALLVTANALVERVAVRSTMNSGTDGYACRLYQGTIRDSTCFADEQTGGGKMFALAAFPVGSGAFTTNVVNVTTGGTDFFFGLEAFATANLAVVMNAKNVITTDVLAKTIPSGSSAAITLTYSADTGETFSGSNVSINSSDPSNLSTGAPLLVDPANGDLRQLPGSPTIDAGATDPLLGTQDLEFEARNQGTAPDMGADEYSPPAPPPLDPQEPDTKAPVVTITAQPKAKVKTKKKTALFSIAFTADESATFACSLDGRPAANCSSPFTGKAKQGKHTVSVTATDAAGNASAAAAVSWTVKRKRPRG